MELIDRSKLEAFGATCKSQDYMDGVKDTLEYIDSLPTVDAIPMKVPNKINELVSEGYTVCFKFHPGDYIGIEVTYDRVYHAKHMLTRLDDIKPEHVSDCVVTILDDLKHKIEYLKGYLEKGHEIV